MQDAMRLRRIALSSQGLLKAKSFGRGGPGALGAIRHLGYVQIDTISVVERAHHHVIHSRVPGYQPAMINQLLGERNIFEYWSHAAAFLPMEDFRFSLPYKRAIKSGQTHWYKDCDKKLMSELLARIRLGGPLRSRDVVDTIKKGTGWWDWKPAKKALEQLYMQGDLMVSGREGVQKVYDLSERVLPSHIDCSLPTIEELAEHLLLQQLRCHGVVSLKGVSYLRREATLRDAIKTAVSLAVAQGRLDKIDIDGESYFVNAGALDVSLPRVSNRLLILSPFDNCVIQRKRLKAIFNYPFQLECYLPESKRLYGYFCLPLLFRDQFIGRMDCKAHRKERRLEIKALHLENTEYDQHLLVSALFKALQEFVGFQQCDNVVLKRVYPNKFKRIFVEAFKTLA